MKKEIILTFLLLSSCTSFTNTTLSQNTSINKSTQKTGEINLEITYESKDNFSLKVAAPQLIKANITAIEKTTKAEIKVVLQLEKNSRLIRLPVGNYTISGDVVASDGQIAGSLIPISALVQENKINKIVAVCKIGTPKLPPSEPFVPTQSQTQTVPIIQTNVIEPDKITSTGNSRCFLNGVNKKYSDVFITPDSPSVEFTCENGFGNGVVATHMNLKNTEEGKTDPFGIRVNSNNGYFSVKHTFPKGIKAYGKGYVSSILLNIGTSASDEFYLVPRTPKEGKFQFEIDTPLVPLDGPIKIRGRGAIPLEKVQLQAINDNYTPFVFDDIIADKDGNYTKELIIPSKKFGLKNITAVDTITNRQIKKEYEVLKTSRKLNEVFPNAIYSKNISSTPDIGYYGNFKQVYDTSGGTYILSYRENYESSKIEIIAQNIDSDGNTNQDSSFVFTPTTMLEKVVLSDKDKRINYNGGQRFFDAQLINNKWYFTYMGLFINQKSPKIVVVTADKKGNQIGTEQVIDGTINTNPKLVNSLDKGVLFYIGIDKNLMARKFVNGVIDSKEVKITDVKDYDIYKPENYEVVNRANDFVLKITSGVSYRADKPITYKLLDYNGSTISTYSGLPNLSFFKDKKTNEVISMFYNPISKPIIDNYGVITRNYSLFPNYLLFLYDRGAMFDYISGITVYNQQVDNFISNNVQTPFSKDQTSLLYKDILIKNPVNDNIYIINGSNIAILNPKGKFITSKELIGYKFISEPTFDSNGNILVIVGRVNRNNQLEGYNLLKINPETLERKTLSNIIMQ